MKRVFLFFVIVTIATCLVQGQSVKKIAVCKPYSHDNSISAMQEGYIRSCFDEAVSTGLGYITLDKNAVDSIIEEYHYDKAIRTLEISRMRVLCRHLGVPYIIIPDAMTDGVVCYIVARLFDANRGELYEIHDGWCGPSESEIRGYCFQLVSKLFAPVIGRVSVTTARPIGPRNDERRDSTITISVGKFDFRMVYVEAGSFIMGRVDDGTAKCNDDTPAHKVTISRNYHIGQYEVTQELYEAVMDTNPSRWQEPNRPVEQVSWYDAQEFCQRLSHITGSKFSLPTEAEWEFAARGGKKSRETSFSGDSIVEKVAWYCNNSGEQTHAVGELKANELGIYDMSGNVWEWCQDRMGKYGRDHQINPKGPEMGAYRVLRGGGWFDKETYSRTTFRDSAGPSYRNSNYGFRVVLRR